jgi:hypothetical protein
MAHRTFGSVRLAPKREAITFDFGIYGEESFTVVPEPSLGDCFDLYDAPEPTPTNALEAARACAKFIERMLDPEDRPRFRETLHRIPSNEAHVIVEAASYIAEQVSGFPTQPSGGSSAGRPSTGKRSKSKPGGSTRSRN